MSDEEYYNENNKPKFKRNKEQQEYFLMYQRKYYEDNREAIRKKQKEYRDKHPEIFKIKIKCDCGVWYIPCNKTSHERSKTHNELLNKKVPEIKIKKHRGNKRVLCDECGGYFLSNQYSRHCKTKRHVHCIYNSEVNLFDDIIQI
jgi:hypothetical protein